MIGDEFINKCLNGNFVCSIKCCRSGSTGIQCVFGQSEAGKTFFVGGAEVELMGLRKVEGGKDAGVPPGMKYGVLESKSHLRRGKLCEDGAVFEFHHGVDDALWMDDDLNLVRRHVEEPPGFNDFQAFVGHGGGVDGDLGSHVPVRVLQGLFQSDIL